MDVKVEVIEVRSKAERDAMLERFYSHIDGKKLTTKDGVSGTVKVTYESKRWGTSVRVTHEPDAKGRKSSYYRQIRQRLGDDWTTDLTDSEWLYCDSPLAEEFDRALRAERGL